MPHFYKMVLQQPTNYARLEFMLVAEARGSSINKKMIMNTEARRVMLPCRNVLIVRLCPEFKHLGRVE